MHITDFHGRMASFQSAIALHESNGIDIIIALVLNDINPLGKQRMDLVLELKVCGSSVFAIHLLVFLFCVAVLTGQTQLSVLLRRWK